MDREPHERRPDDDVRRREPDVETPGSEARRADADVERRPASEVRRTDADVERRPAADVRRTDADTRPAAETRRTTVDESRPETGVAAARDRFGGFDIPATLIGMLTALATLLLLGGIVGAAIGAFGYQTGLDRDDIEEVTIGGLIAALVVLFLAYLIGGWAAARMARYDGARNGLMVVVWTLILAAILAALGALLGDEYNVLERFELPQWFSRDALTTSAIISGLVGIATMLVGGVLGGLWGERYHRRADETITGTRERRRTTARSA